MRYVKNISHYIHKNNIDIAAVVACLGIFLSTYIENAWIISILACFFIKDEEKQVKA